MGREVRRVPANWQHPKDAKGNLIPLYEGGDFAKRDASWAEEYAKWQEGLRRNFGSDEWTPIEPEYRGTRFSEWDGPRPSPDDYMPDWPEAERTHLMMYEDTSEGTPISPAFATPEELARWLADNGASSFGSSTATYEQWLGMARRGWAPSMALQGGQMMSGVEFMSRDSDGSGEAGETALAGSTEGDSAGPQDIAQTPPGGSN